MKRYTVFDTKLRRYVVPLSRERGQDEPPEIRTMIGGPQDLLFGAIIDQLAGLEIAAEAVEEALRVPPKVYVVMTSNPHGGTALSGAYRSEREAQARADLLNRIGNGKEANHWVAEMAVYGEEDEG